MINILYQIIILPIETTLEILYKIFYNCISGNTILITFLVSYTVTLLCLPFYYRADKIKETNDEKLQKLEPEITNIKKNFKGDEQFFMLKTLYRQNNYHPLMALKNSFSLLIQIPFFIAAYHFFLHMDFGILSKPDGLISYSGYKINILPILMTFINIVVCEMYLKARTWRTRIQPYSLALIFLILLYQSPAILVIYWTFNNILFALKNACLKMPKPIKKISLFTVLSLSALYIIHQGASYWLAGKMFLNLSVVIYADLLLLFAFAKNYKIIIQKINVFFKYFRKKSILLLAIILSIFILGPFKIFDYINNISIILFILSVYFIYISFLQDIVNKLIQKFKNYFLIKKLDNSWGIFIISCICLYILQSLFIPTNIISTDPNMFSLFSGKTSYIFQILIYQLSYLFGYYLFWLPIIYIFTEEKYRLYLSLSLSAFVTYFMINYLTIGKNLGTISTEFIFSDTNTIYRISGNSFDKLLNIILLFVILSIIIFVVKKYGSKIIVSTLCIVLFSQIFIIGLNTKKIVNNINDYNSIGYENSNKDFEIELTKSGKNVIVIFLDRFLSSFLPIILDEKPELKDVFSGFTYYPNTVSFHGHTILGEPPMIGGYEYTPLKLDKDPRNINEEFIEANLVLLTLFKNNGFISTVIDPVGEFYTDIRFISNFHKYYTDRGINHTSLYGKYNYIISADNNSLYNVNVIKKQCIKYSLLNIIPKCVKEGLYNTYLAKESTQTTEEKYFEGFYSALYYLDKITNSNAKQNTFTLINNDAPHFAHYLQYPDYNFQENITNVGNNPFDDEYTHKSYHSTIASLLQIAKYMNHLKKLGVYNNSRIILVSDHGFYLYNNIVTFPQYSKHRKEMEILTAYNPLLMVKDFNDNGSLRTDNTFMTNADTPYLATQNLIKNAKNPFTGKEFSIDEKLKGIDVYTDHRYWSKDSYKNSKTIIDKNPVFYHVSKDVRDIKNWE